MSFKLQRVVAGVKGVSIDYVVKVCNQNVHDLIGSLNSEG
jgi:hypothetical protein